MSSNAPTPPPARASAGRASGQVEMVRMVPQSSADRNGCITRNTPDRQDQQTDQRNRALDRMVVEIVPKAATRLAA